jgi:hypothetical protein
LIAEDILKEEEAADGQEPKQRDERGRGAFVEGETVLALHA